jgi:succinyl-CoA synthetase beta subunit
MQFWFMKGVDIDHQIYMAILLDRETANPVIVCSKRGGMGIEEVARDSPEDI